jgi:hypothetical protein
LTPLQFIGLQYSLDFFFGLGFTQICFIFMLTLGNECCSAAFALNTIQVAYSSIKKKCVNYTKRNAWQEMEEMTLCGIANTLFLF